MTEAHRPVAVKATGRESAYSWLYGVVAESVNTSVLP